MHKRHISLLINGLVSLLIKKNGELIDKNYGNNKCRICNE